VARTGGVSPSKTVKHWTNWLTCCLARAATVRPARRHQGASGTKVLKPWAEAALRCTVGEIGPDRNTDCAGFPPLTAWTTP